MMNHRTEGKAVVLALVAVALWSTVAVAFKKALVGLEPVDLVIMASFVSWLALGLILLFRRLTRQACKEPGTEKYLVRPDRQTLVKAAVLGLLNPVAYYLILFAAYKRLPAQVAQPLNYTWPLFLALLAAPVSRRYPTSREIAAIFISLVGVILISWRPAGSDASLDTLGVSLALGSGIIWALYWLVGSNLAMDGILRLFIGFTLAVAVMAVIWGLRGFPLPGNPETCLAVLWVGLFEMGITFLFWNGALESTDRPARIGNLVYLGPFVSLVWIRLFLGEQIRPATIAGIFVIVAGILFGQGLLRRPRKSGAER